MRLLCLEMFIEESIGGLNVAGVLMRIAITLMSIRMVMEHLGPVGTLKNLGAQSKLLASVLA